MQSFLPFLQIFLILLIEGTALALLLLPISTMSLAIALGLPLSALTNVLLVFLYTVTGVPLTLISITMGHLAILGALILLIYLRPQFLMDLERPVKEPKKRLSTVQKSIIIASLLIIVMNAGYSFVHAILLPTVQYDSATNWTMRSEISFVDHHIAFDADESRGMAKPQYPFLFHALQITANQGQERWLDTAANGILYLLSIATFGAVFLMIRKLHDSVHSVATLATIISIPLLGLHLAQGYGDLNLLQYFLLSLCCLGMWIESTHARRHRWLMLSGIFVAASVWTKSEGSVFGLLPWLLTVSLICGRNKQTWKEAIPAIIVTFALSVPWPIFAWLQGLSLTPHSSDTMLQLHLEGVKEALIGLFGRGSFGLTWYALMVLVPVFLYGGWKHHPAVKRPQLPLLLWGSVMFLEFLFIYLATPNVRFLLNAESFYRQMMIPAAMLILACSLCIKPKAEKHL